MQAGGLTWRQLAELGVAALHSGGCGGWSLSIYNRIWILTMTLPEALSSSSPRSRLPPADNIYPLR